MAPICGLMVLYIFKDIATVINWIVQQLASGFLAHYLGDFNLIFCIYGDGF